MEKEFEGQVAIVTGAGLGIGFEIARQLALHGAAVLLNDIDETKALEAQKKIVAEGGICHPISGDVSDVNFIQKMVDKAVADFGQLTIAVANAGITSYGNFFDFTEDAFQRLLSVNLQGSFFLAQRAARQFQQQKSGGNILFMSSVTGHRAHHYLSAYGMTKAGLEMLAKALIAELAPLGIRVNTVAPGATLTERTLSDEPDYNEKWQPYIPDKRPATPLDIANAALFLLSPKAAHINGQTILVDGGWTSIGRTPDLSSFQ